MDHKHDGLPGTFLLEVWTERWGFVLNLQCNLDFDQERSKLVLKQILNNRCFISIEQLPFHEEDKRVFMSEIVLKIQNELKKIDTSQERHIEGVGPTRYLAFDSIFLQEMEIKEKIYNIFVYEKDSKWERFRRLFRKSEENIR